jgi:DNA-binding NarL/FixJ family response regulator
MNKLSVVKAMLMSRNHILRLGIQNIIKTQPHIRLVEWRSGEIQTDDLLTRERPHLIIVDSKLEMDLQRLFHNVRLLVPGAKIVLLIGTEENTRTGEALASGMDGIILSVQPPEVLLACIHSLFGVSTRDVHEEADPQGPTSTERMLSASQRHDLQRTGILTEREREVIQLIGQGLTNKAIADRLCISPVTVRHHLTRIFDKLGVTTRQKLLIRAHQYGLVELSVPA